MTRLITAWAALLIGAITFGAPASAQPVRSCADLGGSVEAARICRIKAESDTYAIDISYPLDYPDQQSLTDYITTNKDDFIAFVGSIPRRDRTHDRGITPHSYASRSTASVVLEVYGDTGAHPVTSFHAFNYDPGTHAPITFGTAFTPGAVGALDPIVQREMERRWVGYLDPAPHNTLGARVYQDFALTDDAVIFYIGQGMWLPEVAGPQRVSISRSELASVLI